jgi:hypothetical protein
VGRSIIIIEIGIGVDKGSFHDLVLEASDCDAGKKS